jgi:epoxyqueuosine reductase
MRRGFNMDLKERLRSEGRRLGLTRIGFASAGEPPLSRRFLEWLQSGYAGEMDWLQRRRRERCDPTVLAPWVRGLILAALPYEPASIPASTGAARISRYARGIDYHRVLRRRLDALGRILQEAIPGARVRPAVDTAAILEKPHAAAAGIGWQGKHTNLIHPRSGSWFLLGELLTDREFAPDEEILTDRCGTCTRCLDACPTDAFPEPYVLDSRRCISYLTIEHKSAIPEDLRPWVGNWVFGCDICQEVCPWNSTPEPGDPELAAREDAPRLAELIRMSREEFNRRFAGTAIRRTGWSRFLRNVAVALGNSGDPDSLPALEDALRISDPLVQEHVLWAMRRIQERSGHAPASEGTGEGVLGAEIVPARTGGRP